MARQDQPDTGGSFHPVASNERIQALDVIRGFALVGIFLMNVEYFNRALSSMQMGMPRGLHGLDWVAGWGIFNFVQGKFWTMFSLLFGMGFAVMLGRAERAGRPFLVPYLRRVAALAAFGVVHHIFIWGGDILFSYAVGAASLLIVLYGNWKYILLGLAALVGLGLVTHGGLAWACAGSLTSLGLVAWYLRGGQRMSIFGRRPLVLTCVLLALGVLAGVAAVTVWVAPGAPEEARIPLLVATPALLAVAALAERFHEPLEPRRRRLGLALYGLPFVMMIVFGAIQRFVPPPAAVQPVSTAQASPARKTPARRRAEREAEQAKELATQQTFLATETREMRQGTYVEFLKFRAKGFVDTWIQETGFAFVLVGMFLLGTWFVRSGIMADTAGHLPLFRRLACVGLPLGLGLDLLGNLAGYSHVLGQDHDGFLLASGMQMLGNLPACLGYVSLVVLALHGGPLASRIRVLAPAGRMALTNYLAQSVICSFVFFGYGLHRFGMGRAWQVVFVAAVFSLQVAFSHWWLNRFRYGPMEWLWRAITYAEFPPMRI
jgi:uncharacterized membrane protein YeiB